MNEGINMKKKSKKDWDCCQIVNKTKDCRVNIVKMTFIFVVVEIIKKSCKNTRNTQMNLILVWGEEDHQFETKHKKNRKESLLNEVFNY